MHRILDQRTVLSDDLPNRIIIGKVKIKPNVKAFTSTSAIFEDGTEENIDVVIFATGYTLSFPFLSDDSGILDSQYSMFKYVFPPELEKPTLAFIGILQPAGAIIPTSELQSRWVVRVFTGMYLSCHKYSMFQILCDLKVTQKVYYSVDLFRSN